MNRRTLAATFTLVASVLATSSAFAAPLAFHAADHSAFTATTKARMVTVNLRNDSTEPITLKAGDDTVTLAPGKVTPVKLAVGTHLTADATTPHYTPGTLIAVVDQQLDKATLSFK